jgi:hypothetical protein
MKQESSRAALLDRAAELERQAYGLECCDTAKERLQAIRLREIAKELKERATDVSEM